MTFGEHEKDLYGFDSAREIPYPFPDVETGDPLYKSDLFSGQRQEAELGVEPPVTLAEWFAARQLELGAPAAPLGLDESSEVVKSWLATRSTARLDQVGELPRIDYISPDKIKLYEDALREAPINPFVHEVTQPRLLGRFDAFGLPEDDVPQIPLYEIHFPPLTDDRMHKKYIIPQESLTKDSVNRVEEFYNFTSNTEILRSEESVPLDWLVEGYLREAAAERQALFAQLAALLGKFGAKKAAEAEVTAD